MAKKKNKPQVINNIQGLNLEIDYDKLAKAIVKVQNSSESENADDDNSLLDDMWEGNIPKGKLFSRTLSKILQLFFCFLAIASVFATVCLSAMIVAYLFRAEWHGFDRILNNAGYISALLLIIGFDAIFVVFSWKIGFEIGIEQDKNYIVSSFSCVVSLVALIVALIALFKGVG